MGAKKALATNATARARATFLLILAENCNVTESCRAAGVHRSTAYRWREDDPVFAAAWAEAEEQAADALEAIAWERAKAGQSDRMLEILLKGHRPKYRDKQQVEHSGVLQVDHTARIRAEIDEVLGRSAPIQLEAEHDGDA